MVSLGLQALCVAYQPCLLIAAGLYAYVASILQEPLFELVIRFDDPLDDAESENVDL